MKFINGVRTVALLLAAVLFFSGIGSAMHPKYKVVAHSETPAPKAGEFNAVEITTSTSSRVFGIIRLLIAAGLAGWVVSTFFPRKIRQPVN